MTSARLSSIDVNLVKLHKSYLFIVLTVLYRDRKFVLLVVLTIALHNDIY